MIYRDASDATLSVKQNATSAEYIFVDSIKAAANATPGNLGDDACDGMWKPSFRVGFSIDRGLY